MPPTVSVVIPAYNSRAWITETLDSVFGQTYPHPQIELIVVDDGSQDDTADVARSVMRDRTIRGQVIQRAHNGGVSAARNAGWTLARGQWIQFLDADDLLAPAKIQLQMEATLRVPDNVAVVYSNWQEIAHIGGTWQPSSPVHELFVDDHPVERIVQDLHFGYVGPTLIRKSCLAAIGGFDEECSLGEDLDCMLRMAMAGFGYSRVACDDAPFFYRQTPDSLWKHGVRAVDAMRQCLGIYRRAEDFLRLQSPDGALCEDVRVGLAKRYAKWAEFYMEHDPDNFRDIVRRVARLGIDPPPDLSRNVRVLSSVIGWEKALRVRSSYRRAAALMHPSR